MLCLPLQTVIWLNPHQHHVLLTPTAYLNILIPLIRWWCSFIHTQNGWWRNTVPLIQLFKFMKRLCCFYTPFWSDEAILSLPNKPVWGDEAIVSLLRKPFFSDEASLLLKFVKRAADTIGRSTLVSEDRTVGTSPTFGGEGVESRKVITSKTVLVTKHYA